MTPSYSKRVAALALTFATASLMIGTPAWSGDNALLTGRVLQPDGATPRSGVVVALLGDEALETFRSAPTGDEGAFKIDAAPAGAYTLVAETSQGAFVGAAQVDLTAGENPPLALTLQPQASIATLAPAQSGTRNKLPTWATYSITGLIVITAVVLIDEVTEDVEDPASPF